MDSTRFGYYFEDLGRSAYEGPNDPSMEHFSDKDLEDSVVREMIQNSLDAHTDFESTVTVEFELRHVAVQEILGVQDLVFAAEAAIDASGGLEGEHYLEQARDTLRSNSVPVLRVGDYGTHGLRGSESKESPTSALSALTRGVGVSSNDDAIGSRGGSYGIGSSIGLLASKARVVCYASLASDKPDEVVYASLCRLASFKDRDGIWKKATGYYTSIDDQDFVYLRDPKPIGAFPRRDELGTDVYMVGYAGETADPELTKLRRSIIRNFLAAIVHGRLVVRGVCSENKWQLDSETLEDFITSDDELTSDTLPFFIALTNERPVERDLPIVGPSQLYINMDARLQKKLHTQVMRKPLMKIQVFKHTTIHRPYAAVFVCDNEKGDSLLRSIEPAAHDKWNIEGPKANKAAVDQIKAFIREELRKRAPVQQGESVTIRGLERLLPKSSSPAGDNGAGGRTPSHQENAEESPIILGVDRDFAHYARRGSERTSANVRQSGKADETSEDTGRRGHRGGGNGTTDDPKPGIESPVHTGDGRSRIRSAHIHLRSFFPSDGIAKLVVTPKRDIKGDLDLIALGPQDRDNFPLYIERAALLTPDGSVVLSSRGSSITDLDLKAGQKVTLELTLKAKTRYRLGVSDA